MEPRGEAQLLEGDIHGIGGDRRDETGSGREKITLVPSEMFQKLIDHGHNFKDIKGYSLPQIILFTKRIYKMEDEKRKIELILNRIATLGDAKIFDGTVKDLSGE